MKRFITACLTLALIISLFTFASAAEVPALHPSASVKNRMTDQQITAFMQTVKENMKDNPAEPHPADKLKTGLTLSEILDGYTVLEVTESTGTDTLGNVFRVTSYRVEPPEDAEENLSAQGACYVPCPVGPEACGKNDFVGVDVIRDQSTGSIKYYVCHYGCKKCGGIDHSEVVYK